ncbi:MAG: DUF4290 domain-containing protein [Muribaculaceae bacterium]|nr:DUF4290 domain-containing protein [Muribaculaceae bacterium]
MTYNTRLKKLTLPEYGRNIQRMVDHCVSIEDRDERTRCARSIIFSMGNLFPEFRNAETNDRKLWDHLVIMSDFKLDVDFPCEVISAESLATKPMPIEREKSGIRYYHYGRSLVNMVEKAAEMENGPERDELIHLLANHMKKLMLAVNKDGVEDEKIFKDLYRMTDGRISIEPGSMKLHEFKEMPQQGGKKKKKK